MSVMRTKSIEQTIREGDEPEYQLKKKLTALDLTVFGRGRHPCRTSPSPAAPPPTRPARP